MTAGRETQAQEDAKRSKKAHTEGAIRCGGSPFAMHESVRKAVRRDLLGGFYIRGGGH